jgi:hypothetical protein
LQGAIGADLQPFIIERVQPQAELHRRAGLCKPGQGDGVSVFRKPFGIAARRRLIGQGVIEADSRPIRANPATTAGGRMRISALIRSLSAATCSRRALRKRLRSAFFSSKAVIKGCLIAGKRRIALEERVTGPPWVVCLEIHRRLHVRWGPCTTGHDRGRDSPKDLLIASGMFERLVSGSTRHGSI